MIRKMVMNIMGIGRRVAGLGVVVCLGVSVFSTAGCKSHKVMVSATAVDSAAVIDGHYRLSLMSMDSLLQNECWTLHDVMIRVEPDSVGGTPGAIIGIARAERVRERNQVSRLQSATSLEVAESIELHRLDKSSLQERKSVESPLKWVWWVIDGVLCLCVCVKCVKLFSRSERVD